MLMNAPVGKIEYWVMRVLAPREAVKSWQARATPLQVLALQQRIDRGDLVYVGGDLCEPIEVYDNQDDATGRAVKEHTRTGHVHKVVLNAEI